MAVCYEQSTMNHEHFKSKNKGFPAAEWAIKKGAAEAAPLPKREKYFYCYFSPPF